MSELIEAEVKLARQISNLISEYLGPAFPRLNANGVSNNATALAPSKIATLVALRDRIDSNPSAASLKRELLIWHHREAVRTEFFHIHYPKPPTEKLLRLVTQSEIVLTDFSAAQRPIYFPGARVAVPTEVGTHRAATTLQLRYKPQSGTTVTEVLLHLDGPGGGSFQWVPSSILMLLSSCVPIPQPQATATARAPAPRNTPSGARGRRAATTGATGATGATGTYSSRQSRAPRRRTDSRLNGPRQQTTTLPNAFLPYALRSTSPPPRKRLRPTGIDYPLSMTSGSIRKTLDSLKHTNEADIDAALQNSIIERTLGIESLLGRRKNMSLGGIVEYFVKWSGAPISAGSWESRASLLEDVPGLVISFDTRHPEEPTMCLATVESEPEVDQTHSFNEVDCTKASETPGNNGSFVDTATEVSIPEYVDTPILELNFCGMELHIRRNTKYSLFLDKKDAELDRKKRLTCFKKENRTAFDKVFAHDSEYRPDPEMTVAKSNNPLDMPRLTTPLLPVLQKSVTAHSLAGRHLIPFPPGLGRVLSRNVDAVVPMKDVLNAPASWESYLMSCGLQCSDWQRDLLPEMPTAPEWTEELLDTVSQGIHASRTKLLEQRDKEARLRTRRYVGKPSVPRSNSAIPNGNSNAGTKEEKKPQEGTDRDIINSAIALARTREQGSSSVNS